MPDLIQQAQDLLSGAQFCSKEIQINKLLLQKYSPCKSILKIELLKTQLLSCELVMVCFVGVRLKNLEPLNLKS